MRQEITGGNGTSGQTGEDIKNIINENFNEIYHNTLDTKTDNYTLVLGDEQHLIKADKATAITFTVPPNSDVAFPVGTRIRLKRIGVGVLSIAQGAGVTVTGSSGVLTDAGLLTEMLLEKTGTNTWDLDNGSQDELTDYTTTFTGVTGAVTTSAAKYVLRGKLCTVHLVATATSNANTFTLTLPFAAANTYIQTFPVIVINNGATASAPGKLNTRANSNIADMYLTVNGLATAWTTSAAKGVAMIITYMIA
jgi:hypothetical protein